VYQTNLDLFYSSKNALVGTLAFSLSSQQLFIRVNDGWRVVKLEGFHPALEAHASVLSDDTANFQEPPTSNQVNGHMADKDQVLHLIALNTPLSGDMRGVRGADFACYQQARTAGFTTTFRAFLSSQVQDLNKIVHFSDQFTPVVNLRGDRLFDSWKQMFQDPKFAERATIFSFDRRDVMTDNTWQEKLVWHGSDSAGVRSEGRYCEAWRSADSKFVGVASPLDRRQVLGVQDVDCSRKLVVLCIENMSKHNVDKRLGKKRIPKQNDNDVH
jgi:collagen type XV alpha